MTWQTVNYETVESTIMLVGKYSNLVDGARRNQIVEYIWDIEDDEDRLFDELGPDP